MEQLEAIIDALTQKVSTLIDLNTQLRAQLALSVSTDAVQATQGKAQALLDSLAPLVP